MIDLKQLILVAPFPEQTKKELTEREALLSEDKKAELIEMCWALISSDYQNRLSNAVQKATLEMAEGTKTYSEEDFNKIENDLFGELIRKLGVAENQEKIDEIKKQLLSQTGNSNQTPS